MGRIKHNTKDVQRAAVCGAMVLCVALALAAQSGCSGVSAQSRNAQGVELFQQSRFPEALRQFQEASYADPNNADALYNIAATLHRLGKAENRPDDLKQAEQYYQMCLDRSPNHRDCYRGLAVLLAEQNRNDEAYYLLQDWVDRQPTSSDARVELARLFYEWGDRERAKANLLDALNIDPQNPRALASLGKIREEAGETQQALAAYQRSLAGNSQQPDVASRMIALRSSLVAPQAGGNPNATRLGSTATPPR